MNNHNCDVSLACASLIHQPWMKSTKHIPATLCRCGQRYWSWSVKKWFDVKRVKEVCGDK